MKFYYQCLGQMWGMTPPFISSVRSVNEHFAEDLTGSKQQTSQEKV